MLGKHAIIDELIAIVGDDGVVHDKHALLAYQNDGFPIAKGRPLAVVLPRETEQVVECVKAIRRHGLAVIPRGSGTGLAGGAVAFGGGVIVGTSRMTRIDTIDLANRMACVQAGVRNIQLCEEVARLGEVGRRYHFSPDPSSEAASTIAGNAATNAGGIRTLKYGVTTSHILGVEMVTTDGDVIIARPGGVTTGFGPDLPALICGSEGTLGIITRLWCRLTPVPTHFRTLIAFFRRTEDACSVVSETIAAGITPASMELMDGAMIKVVEDAFGFGLDTTAQALLLIEIDGIDALLDGELQTILDIIDDCEGFGIKRCADAAARARLWKIRKSAFGAIGRISKSYCTQDACIPRSRLPEALVRIMRIGEEHGFTITNVFHAGDGNVHPIMLFDEDDPDQVQRVLRMAEDILEYCITIGGAITGEHGVGVEKLHLMQKMFTRPTIQTFQRIRNAFDADHAFNDGKLIPSDTVTIELLKPLATDTPGGAL